MQQIKKESTNLLLMNVKQRWMDSLRPFLKIKPTLPDNGPDYETQGMLLSWQPSMN